MTNPKNNSPELADIFNEYLPAYKSRYKMGYEQIKAARHIQMCRTSALGGHVKLCNACGHVQIQYHSCRDRHCPKCQTLTKERWLEARKAELLPVQYFHVVFTLPHDINSLALSNKKTVYSILFKSVSDTLKQFAKDPKQKIDEEEIGFIAILHTWDQKLNCHLHLHCIIPAVSILNKGYLFPVKALSLVFRGKFMEYLKTECNNGMLSINDKKELFKKLWSNKWVVYAKPPFRHPEDIVEYLGRYTHRVAISNNRITAMKDGKVKFLYRNRKIGLTESLCLDAVEFIRRFMLHVLPSGFMKIRYYGFLANRNKREKVGHLRQKMGLSPQIPEKAEKPVREMMLELTGNDINLCPVCKKGTLAQIARICKTRQTEKHIVAFALG